MPRHYEPPPRHATPPFARVSRRACPPITDAPPTHAVTEPPRGDAAALAAGRRCQRRSAPRPGMAHPKRPLPGDDRMEGEPAYAAPQNAELRTPNIWYPVMPIAYDVRRLSTFHLSPVRTGAR